MSLIEGIRASFRLFGQEGILLVSKARLLKRPVEVITSVPGAKHPIRVRLRTSDISVLHQVFLINEYECEFSRIPKTIIDAGANIGLTTVFYANKYPEARIIAIEPESSNFEMLKKNAAPYPNITCVHAALWGEDKPLAVVDPGLGHYGFQTKDRPRVSLARESVQGVTIGRLMQQHALDFIDILKLDIEGAEKEVFEASATWIDKVGVVIVEMHDRYKVGCSRSTYLATKAFDVELQRGETVFLVRKSFLEGMSPVTLNAETEADAYERLKSVLPLKILRSF